MIEFFHLFKETLIVSAFMSVGLVLVGFGGGEIMLKIAEKQAEKEGEVLHEMKKD